jgi:high-affinity Fe2+/Pb2+ permease
MWALLKPELMLFGLIGIVPFIGFTIWASRTSVRDRSSVMTYGFVLILAGLTLVVVNYLTDVFAFQALTNGGYVVFQKHNSMLMWLFAFVPCGLGAGIFVNAITSKET